MKEQRIFIEIIEMEDGKRYYSVGGGLENSGNLTSLDTPGKCVREVENRLDYTLKYM